MLTGLNEKDSRRILSEESFGHLGCVLQSGEPYVVPINYFYRDGAVYCHSLEGLKVAAMRLNPKVCLQVERAGSSFAWSSVVAFGEFEEIKDARRRGMLFREFADRFQRLTPVEAVKHNVDAASKVVLFSICIDRITGLAEN